MSSLEVMVYTALLTTQALEKKFSPVERILI